MSSTGFADSHAVETAFYTAFRQLDLDLMRALWTDSPETACVHPGGDLLQGKAAVMDSWAEIFRGAVQPTISVRLLSVQSHDRLAVHLVREQIRSPGGQQASVIATNVYRLEGSAWRMLLHHASLPLVESSPSSTTEHALH
jgi:hypothetical protein